MRSLPRFSIRWVIITGVILMTITISAYRYTQSPISAYRYPPPVRPPSPTLIEKPDHPSPRRSPSADQPRIPKNPFGISPPPSTNQEKGKKKGKLSHPILIFQHFHTPPILRELHEASERSHRRYAEAHGYGYMVDRTDYMGHGAELRKRSVRAERVWGSSGGRAGGVQMDEDLGRGEVNKIFALLGVVLSVLGTVDQPDWIFYTDADTLILNPSIPLHLLLPPRTIQPTPHLLLSQDLNGLNTGVLLFRPTTEIITFLSQCLSVHEELKTSRKGFKGTDQHLFGEVLQHSDNGVVWREIPQIWFNAYDDAYSVIRDSPHTIEGSHKEQVRVEEERLEPKLQIHYVSESKYNPQWRGIEAIAEEVYEDGKRLVKSVGGRAGDTGFGMRDERMICERAAERWWSSERKSVMRYRKE